VRQRCLAVAVSPSPQRSRARRFGSPVVDAHAVMPVPPCRGVERVGPSFRARGAPLRRQSPEWALALHRGPAGAKDEPSLRSEAGGHQLVRVRLAICDVQNGRASSFKPRLGDFDAALPSKELLVREVLGLPSGHEVLAGSTTRLAASRKHLCMRHTQWSPPVMGVDEERQMQGEPRLPRVEVPDLAGIRVPEHAIRRVVDREHEPSVARACCGAERVRIQQLLEADSVVVEQAVGPFQLGARHHRVWKGGAWCHSQPGDDLLHARDAPRVAKICTAQVLLDPSNRVLVEMFRHPSVGSRASDSASTSHANRSNSSGNFCRIERPQRRRQKRPCSGRRQRRR